MTVHLNECAHQGIDAKRLARIGRRLAKCLDEINELGLSVFGGSWTLSIRGDDELILASFDECSASGGCGADSAPRRLAGHPTQ